MSNFDLREKVEVVREFLRAIHRGENVEVLKERFRNV